MLSEFFRPNDIPAGPILFLRDWGLSWRHPLPRRAEDHRRELIGHMLELYPNLPFVLLGDSGQHDPEVYAQVVEPQPSRVRLVYIRDVSRSRGRRTQVERLARAVTVSGRRLVLAVNNIATQGVSRPFDDVPSICSRAASCTALWCTANKDHRFRRTT